MTAASLSRRLARACIVGFVAVAAVNLVRLVDAMTADQIFAMGVLVWWATRTIR